MINIVITFYKNIFKFGGTTSRKKYWTYMAFYIILNFLILSLVFGFYERYYLMENNLEPSGLLFRDLRFLINLVLVLPLLAGTCRRLRDAGFNPWYVLLPVVNLVLASYPSKNVKLGHIS